MESEFVGGYFTEFILVENLLLPGKHAVGFRMYLVVPAFHDSVSAELVTGKYRENDSDNRWRFIPT